MNTELDASEVTIERQGSALWVILSRPRAFNALTPQSIGQLGAAIDQALSDRSIRSLVVTGSANAFCAGADLKAVFAASAGATETVATSRFLRQVGDVFNRLEALPIPTIAAVNGMTLAGGLELMLCCDFVIAGEDARLGDGHANFGQIPGGGGTVRLPLRIGLSRARQLMFTGTTIPAEQACEWGLVDEVVPGDALLARVRQTTGQIESRSALVLERMKALTGAALHQPIAAALAAELQMSDQHMASHDRNEGLAAFAGKRKPAYLGR